MNLTDGLDGLAAGSSILVCAAYVFIAFWQFRHTCDLLGGAAGCYAVNGVDMQDAAIVAAAMLGAAAGFLWWNAAPARIFMGDTGSLALGGLFGALAIVTNTQLLLVDHRRAVRDGDALGDRPGRSRSAGSAGASSGCRRSTTTSSWSGWPEFTVIVRFWIIAGLCSRGRDRAVLRGLHGAGGGLG